VSGSAGPVDPVFTYRVERRNNEMRLTLTGEVDLAVRTELRTVLAQAQGGPAGTLIVDVGGLELLD